MQKSRYGYWVTFRERSSLLLALGLVIALPTAGHAQFTVQQGWDFWKTITGTSFDFGGGPVPLHGVPVGGFNFNTGTGGDFGRGLGTQGLGDTDTVIKRLDDVTVAGAGDTGTTGLEMEKLQLETDVPVGGNFLFVTLQSSRSLTEQASLGVGSLSQGTMDITFNNPSGGTFDSSLDVFFDIRQGSLNGPIVASSDLLLSSSDNTWGRNPTTPLLINGANNNLNGVDHTNDFFTGDIIEKHPNGAQHSVTSDVTLAPEPGSLAFIGLGVFGLVARRRRTI